MQEQELSVNDILSSIKQILSSKIEEELTVKGKSSELDGFMGKLSNKNTGDGDFEDVSAPSFDQDNDILVLTSAMQIEKDPNIEKSWIQERVSPVVAVALTSEKTSELMMPAIQKWIDENLPPMVERIVSEEVRRIFNTKK